MPNINITASIDSRPIMVASHNGETLTLDLSELSPEMLGQLLYHGSLRILRDCKAGKDEGDAFAACAKRVDAFKSGSFTVLDRAGNEDKWMFAAYRELVEGAQGKMTDAGFTKHKLDIVGKPSGAVKWDDFAAAYGAAKAKAKGETRSAAEIMDAMNAKLRPMADAKREAERATLAKVDVAAIDLF